MKKTLLANKTMIKAVRENGRKLHYYICIPGEEPLYAFTRQYSVKCYEMCKGGMPLNDLMCGKKKDVQYMGLVKYLNYMMPYLADYYGLSYRKGNSKKIYTVA